MDAPIILEKLSTLLEQAKKSIPNLDEQKLEQFRIEVFGSCGIITTATRSLSTFSGDDRAKIGKRVNEVKKEIENLITNRKKTISQKVFQQSTTEIDSSMPGKHPDFGAIHPITKVINEITDIFRYLSFSVARGPEIELDEVNFQKLRLYPDHPSRDTQETYYLNDELLLRVHTSSVQIRYMQSHKPPIRIISPGRVYRRDRIDATHLPSFFQIEGLLVDESSKLTDLLGTLSFFVKRLFGEERKVRFYGHNFPYTEPSLEVEVQDSQGKWLEILGSGMVHPEVLENCGIDSTRYRGWAFGMGADRIAMLKYGITDIRSLYNGDIRFLNQTI